MGNPLPRTQPLTRQKWSGGQQQPKWDSGFSSGVGSCNSSSNPSTRTTAATGGGGGAIAGRQPSSSERGLAVKSSAALSSGDVSHGGRQRTLLTGDQPPVSSAARHHHQQHYHHHHPPGIAPMSGASSSNSNSITTAIAMRDAATNTGDSPSPSSALVAEGESSSAAATSTAAVAAAAAAAAREAFRSGRFRTSVRSKRGERLGEAKELLPKEPEQQQEVLLLRRADAEEEGVVVGGSSSSGGGGAQPKKCSSFRDGLLRRDSSGGLDSLMEGIITATATSAQTEKEGSHSRLLSRGGESSSFRGKQVSTSSSRRESLSFRRETVSSSFRKDVGGSRRKERKNTKSFQDGDLSSIASESARGSPCSIHYNQAPFSGKDINSNNNNSSGIPAPHGLPWASSPSSPDNGFTKSAVPFQWEEAPGKAKTIAAAAEMALARKLVRDESLRRLNAASPRSSIDSHGSFRIEKASSSHGGTRGTLPEHQQQQRPPPPQQLLHSQQPPQQSRQEQQQQPSSSAGPLPLPPSKRPSQEMAPARKDSHSSQLLEDLKAAVVRKQAEESSSIAIAVTKAKPEAPVDDDTRSVISDYCGGETQIDLVAPAAAKFLNREDDVPVPTPVKPPLAAVPFKWEEAPGKPKENVAMSGSLAEPPSLSLPPRLLGGCHNPSKEQAAKILQTYSCNLMDMHWTSSGNPTPLTRSRDATPTRRDRTPTRRDRTPTKRDITPGRREVTPTRRDSTPTRTYFANRAVPKSGPISLPSVVVALESVRDHHSGPLRSNTNPNYLNVPPRSVSQEFARVTQDSALTVLTQDLESSNRTSSDAGSLTQLSYRSSKAPSLSRELQIIKRDSSPDVSSVKRSSDSGSRDLSSHKCKAIVRVTSAVDPSSPTSILCGPDVDSSQRTVSNLSSAYAESSHSHRQETISNHTKTDSCTSLESFVDETYNMPPPWSDGEPAESPYRDLGPIDLPSENSQGNNSIEDGVKAIMKFCKKAKKWNKSKATLRKNSAEPDMWAPTLATYFQKIELGGAILGNVGSQVFPESKDVKTNTFSAPGAPATGAMPASVPCSPLRFIPRSGELPATPDRDRLGARKPMGSMTPVHVITTCRSPSYRVMATDECLSVFCIGKVLSATKARHVKWGRKMRKNSRLMVGAIFAALKRSMLLKCGRHSLPNIPSDKNLLDRDGDVSAKEHTVKSPVDAVHSLSADHQFHRPL